MGLHCTQLHRVYTVHKSDFQSQTFLATNPIRPIWILIGSVSSKPDNTVNPSRARNPEWRSDVTYKSSEYKYSPGIRQ
jgi:hypothetical protein